MPAAPPADDARERIGRTEPAMLITDDWDGSQTVNIWRRER